MSIYKNLFDFQSKVRSVKKDSKGYGYNYASFDNILNTINQALIDSKIGYYHYFEENENKTYCVCVLFAADTETSDIITVKLPLDNPENGKTKMSDIQQLGSSVTYARRYTLTAALGLVTEEDTDGVAKKERKNQQKPKQKLNLNKPDVLAKIQNRVNDVGVDKTIKEAKSKYIVSSEEVDQIKSITLPKEEEINVDEIDF